MSLRDAGGPGGSALAGLLDTPIATTFALVVLLALLALVVLRLFFGSIRADVGTR